MKKTYIVEITSEDSERDLFLKGERIASLNLRLSSDEEAQNFVDGLNETDTFKYYKQTAKIVRIIG